MPQTRNRARTNTSGAQEGDTPEKDATKEVKEEGDQVEEQNEDSLLDGGDQEENGEGNEAEEDAEQKTDEEEDKEKKINESEQGEGAEGGEKEEKDGEQKASEDEEKAKKKIPIELDEKAKTNVVVVVGQITYADLGMTELKLPLLKCTTFEMRFFAEEENKKGYLTMVFTKSWDAYAAIDKLRGLEVPRGENTCNYSCWLLDKKTTHTIMHEENTTLTELETQLNANNEQDPSLRSLFVANIPKSATKELLTAIFAEAQDIVLPLAEPGKNKGYCYIEFSEADKLDEYISKYQDIKIEDGEVSSKIVIRKLGAPITEKTKDRVNRMLKSRALQQIPDLGKKSVSESGRKNVRKGSQNFRGFRRNERFNRQYKPRRYGGGFGPDRRDSPRRNDDGAMALAAIQQLLSQQQMMGRGGRGSGGGGGGGGSGGNFRAAKRRYSGGGGGGSYDDYGGMAKNRRFDSPLGMEGPQHFYDDNYDNWGSGSFQQGYGSGSGGGYSGGGGYGGGSGGGGGGGGYGDGRRRKNFGGKFYKRRN